MFNETKSKNTHVIVERIVADIDSIVRQVRFDGWQTTSRGEREVQQALRRALLKVKLETDQFQSFSPLHIRSSCLHFPARNDASAHGAI